METIKAIPRVSIYCIPITIGSSIIALDNRIPLIIRKISRIGIAIRKCMRWLVTVTVGSMADGNPGNFISSRFLTIELADKSSDAWNQLQERRPVKRYEK